MGLVNRLKRSEKCKTWELKYSDIKVQRKEEYLIVSIQDI